MDLSSKLCSSICPNVCLSCMAENLALDTSLFDPYEYHVDLCNVQKLKSWTLYANFSIIIFYVCLAYKHHWLLPFCITFSDLELGWGSQGQRKAKPFFLIFVYTFPVIRMKFHMLLKQFMLNIPVLFFNEIYCLFVCWLLNVPATG